jgi:organic hydroperoxide reductase OsmC/OhrA
VQITAQVSSSASSHTVSVSTAGNAKSLQVPAKPGGQGSAVNGGEFLMLALATCYCNDIYREAARLKIEVDSVEVEASADFEGVGLAASNIRYRARVSSPASEEEVTALLRETDAVAEVHNTVRSGVAVQLLSWPAGT